MNILILSIAEFWEVLEYKILCQGLFIDFVRIIVGETFEVCITLCNRCAKTPVV
jgi:hypothetical protein